MSALIPELRSIVGDDGCLCGPEELFVYECDGLTLHAGRPLAVVLPRATHEVQAVVRACREQGKARRVVAFLSGCGGDAAIRAHLAGADRVIPVDQLEGELEGLPDA